MKIRTSEDIPFTIATLVGKKQLPDLLFALLSLKMATGRVSSLVIISDGSLERQDIDFLEQWYENCKVFQTLDQLCQYYDYMPQPILSEFYYSYFAAPKLFLLNVVQSVSNCLLLDSDVIFFNNPLARDSALTDCINQQICCTLEDEVESCDPTIIEYGRINGVKISKQVNSGLVYVPQGALNQVDWKQCIPKESLNDINIFAEQSALAAGLTVVGYRFLPKEQFVVALRGSAFPYGDYAPFHDIQQPYESLVCRHFVTPIRYLMWLKAFPKLKASLMSMSN